VNFLRPGFGLPGFRVFGFHESLLRRFDEASLTCDSNVFGVQIDFGCAGGSHLEGLSAEAGLDAQNIDQVRHLSCDYGLNLIDSCRDGDAHARPDPSFTSLRGDRKLFNAGKLREI
jgi:hypothetical protein